MKNIKKLLLFICFVLSFALFSCNDKFVGYRINVVSLAHQGSYTIKADQKENGLYGGKVVITVTAKDGYKYNYATVNGTKETKNPIVINKIDKNYEITLSFSDINSKDDNDDSSNSGNNDVIIDEGTYAGDYYKSLDFNSLSSDDLFDELRKLITTTHKKTTSYNELREKLQYTDASLKDENKIVLFYSQLEIDGTWDGGTSWNREHVWPQSNSWFTTSGAGSDIHHIRPTDPNTNSTRNNCIYAELTTSPNVYTSAANGHILTKCSRDGDRFEPADEVKGDCARIILYLLVRYPESDDFNITKVFESMETLLKWNKQDPVSEFEARRNERAFEVQGNRNPFIDYPSLADKLWG